MSLLLAILAAGCVSSPGDGDRGVTVDYVPSAFPVNPALYTAGDTQYVAYYDSLHRMTVASRRLPDGAWHRRTLDERVGWDSHNSIAMCRDGQGVLHVSGNMHVSPLVYFRSDATGDVATLERVESMTGSDERMTTYPAFMPLADGRLVFHYRSGGSGNGNEIYNILGPDGVWRRLLDEPLTDGRGLMNAYMRGPAMGPDGWFHLIWVWRDTPDCSTNHDLSYARSRDLIHWESLSGTPVPLPITSLTEGLTVDAAQNGGGLINIGIELGFDAENRPVVGYHKYDERGYTQLYVARAEDGAWHTQRLTDWAWRWDFKGNGTIVNELLIDRPRVAADGRLTLGYRRYDPATGESRSAEATADAATLAPLGERPASPLYPAWVTRPERPEPGMTVNVVGDAGDGGYVLRWESLPPNRDLEPEGELPAASELRVVRLP